MISQLLKKKILELTKEEELCSQVLARIRLKKEKLILLLYEEEENDREFSLDLFQDKAMPSGLGRSRFGSPRNSDFKSEYAPCDRLSRCESSYPKADRALPHELYAERYPLGRHQEELDPLTSLKFLDESIENLVNSSQKLTQQLRTDIAFPESATKTFELRQKADEQFDPEARGSVAGVPPVVLKDTPSDKLTEQETVADLILDQIKKMQLWSFGTTYMAQILNLGSDIVSQSLHLESYSRFWQLRKKKAKTNMLETWVTDLDLINSLSSIEVEREQKGSDLPTSEQNSIGLRKGRSRRAFKRSLPPNSTDDLVEKSSSVMDLLNKVFDSNRGKQLDAIGILDYLYPGQTKDWSKEEKRFRVQLVSRELCTSIKRGNWRRISVGVYLHA